MFPGHFDLLIEENEQREILLRKKVRPIELHSCKNSEPELPVN